MFHANFRMSICSHFIFILVTFSHETCHSPDSCLLKVHFEHTDFFSEARRNHLVQGILLITRL